jgi:hypothetical protein
MTTIRGIRFVVMIMLIAVLLGFGSFFIYESQIDYHSQSCVVTDLIDFQCGYTFLTLYRGLNFHAKTTMLLLTNIGQINVTMDNYCFICASCKNTYKVGNTYDCTLIDKQYKITQYYSGIHVYSILAIGIVMIIMGLVMGIVAIIGVIRSRRIGYEELP